MGRSTRGYTSLEERRDIIGRRIRRDKINPVHRGPRMSVKSMIEPVIADVGVELSSSSSSPIIRKSIRLDTRMAPPRGHPFDTMLIACIVIDASGQPFLLRFHVTTLSLLSPTFAKPPLFTLDCR